MVLITKNHKTKKNHQKNLNVFKNNNKTKISLSTLIKTNAIDKINNNTVDGNTGIMNMCNSNNSKNNVLPYLNFSKFVDQYTISMTQSNIKSVVVKSNIII